MGLPGVGSSAWENLSICMDGKMNKGFSDSSGFAESSGFADLRDRKLKKEFDSTKQWHLQCKKSNGTYNQNVKSAGSFKIEPSNGTYNVTTSPTLK